MTDAVSTMRISYILILCIIILIPPIPPNYSHEKIPLIIKIKKNLNPFILSLEKELQ